MNNYIRKSTSFPDDLSIRSSDSNIPLDSSSSYEELSSLGSSRISSIEDLNSLDGKTSPNRFSPSRGIKYKELSRADIENITNFRPINIMHYQRAFVHKSVQKYIKQQRNVPEYLKQSYERYEYLGDSVLNLVVANFLFKKYSAAEGLLTRLRTKLVNGKTLCSFSRHLNFGEYIIMSHNVENIDGRNNDRILEDVFEAFVCAIYLDLGFKYAEMFIIRMITTYIDFDTLEEDNNYKDILLRFCQNKMQSTPTYTTIKMEGPPHSRIFTVAVVIKGLQYKEGSGKCKKTAEQRAAHETLTHFGYFN